MKTLDLSVGKTLLLTRPDSSTSPESNSTFEPTTGESSTENPTTSNQPSTQSTTAPEVFVPSFRNASTSDSTEADSAILVDPVSGKDPALTAENKAKVCLLRTCVSLIPRIMPLFKETELVEILARLIIHVDDELRLIAFQVLKTFVVDLPPWRRFVFPGFTGLILKEITDLHPKLVDNALKMLIQLVSAWRTALSSAPVNSADDSAALILFHLEGFSLFTLCHPMVQRRRYAHLILRECKLIGETTKCFRNYPYHNYAIDVLDAAVVFAMKQLHLQCFYSNLILDNIKPDLGYLIEQSSSWETSINTASYNNTDPTSTTTVNPNSSTTQSGASSFINIINKSSRGASLVSNNMTVLTPAEANPIVEASVESGVNTLVDDTSPAGQSTTTPIPRAFPSSIFTFDPWTECLAVFFSYDFIFTKCPQARSDAWAFIYARLQQLLPYVDPNEPHEVPRTSILFGGGANSLEKIRRAANERDANLNIWKNYLIGACCLTSGSDKYIYLKEYEKALIKTDDAADSALTVNIYMVYFCSLKNYTQMVSSSIVKGI